MGRPDKKPSVIASDASLALYIIGDKLAGNVGTKIANGISGLLLNRYVGPCTDTCEHNHPKPC